jgi:molybdopterin synthase sulfur carrier subunit
MARLVFLGRLEDLAGMEEITTPLERPTALASVLAVLPKDLIAALTSPKVRVALNGAVVAVEQALDDLTIADGDEVAFLPPVSGG